MKPLCSAASCSATIIKNKDIGMGYGTLWMGYGTLVSLVFHNLPSLYPSSFRRNDFLYFNIYDSPAFHLVIYSKKMAGSMRPAEITALKTLNRAFGCAIWDNTIIALTFANLVSPADPDSDKADYFIQLKERNLEEFRQAFEVLSIKEVFECLKMRIYPVGSARILQLPGMEDDWRVEFWRGCLEACREDTKRAVLGIALHGPAFVSMASASGTADAERDSPAETNVLTRAFTFLAKLLGRKKYIMLVYIIILFVITLL